MRLSCVALAFFIGAATLASATSIAVNPSDCGAIPKNLSEVSAEIVGADWSGYRPYMCLYPVKSPTGSTVLFLLALDTSRADAANALIFRHGKPVSSDDVPGNFDPIPKPVVVDGEGNVLAEFPEDVWFPTNEPATISVFFSGWENNFPHKFTIYVDDPTVSSPGWPYCPPPYFWNRSAKRYIEAKGDFYAKCKPAR